MICSSCGAPLTPAPLTGIAVCEHCGLRAPLPAAAADGPGSLNDDLKQVDEWWNRERRPFMSQDRQGNLHPPEEQNVLYVVLIAVGAILALMSAVGGHSWDWTMVGIAGFFFFPILISLPAALLHERTEKRYKAYQKLEAEYQGRRSAVIERHARRP